MKKAKIDKAIHLGHGIDLRIEGILPDYGARKGKGPLFSLKAYLVDFADEQRADGDATALGPYTWTVGLDPEKTQYSFSLYSSIRSPASIWAKTAQDAIDSIEMVEQMVAEYDTFRRQTPEDGSWLDKILCSIQERKPVDAFAAMHAHKLEILSQ